MSALCRDLYSTLPAAVVAGWGTVDRSLCHGCATDACAALERAELAGVLLSSLRTLPTMMDINPHLDGTLPTPRIDRTLAQTVMLAVSPLRTGRPASPVSCARVHVSPLRARAMTGRLY
ncbi:hypothetical protein AURDEDRAFT_168362 [Auricularia subglabra TFB-10046 SS5]|nr:hypothetical protein AURDEDRAFT_168362 [Auricularia subglabra TFB-10046 SS5]